MWARDTSLSAACELATPAFSMSATTLEVLPAQLPILPLRNKVLLPHSVIRVSLASPQR